MPATPRALQAEQRILLLRGQKVMLDFHLAERYAVETRALKQAVRRNPDRFPVDFMFELTPEDVRLLVSQNVIPRLGKLGGAIPMAFTEQGVAMLSSVLRGDRAVQVNIAIMPPSPSLPAFGLNARPSGINLPGNPIVKDRPNSNHHEQIHRTPGSAFRRDRSLCESGRRVTGYRHPSGMGRIPASSSASPGFRPVTKTRPR